MSVGFDGGRPGVEGFGVRASDEPGDPEVSLIAEGQPAMLFIRVPEGRW
jgi:hypothetical protein